MSKSFLLCCLLLALSACSDKHGADAVRHDQHEAGSEHGHGHGGGISVTSFAGTTELFVEYPPLVQGEAAAFAAHLTWTGERFRAVDKGRVVVTLEGGAGAARAEADVSATAGIFRPVLTPTVAGRYRLQVTLSVDAQSYVHDLGEVEVYKNAAAALVAGQAPEPEAGGISFTKEQQWKLDFAHQPVVEHELRASLAAAAVLRAPAAREATLVSPSAGRLDARSDSFPIIGMQVERGQSLLTLAPRLATGVDLATLTADLERARAHHQHTESNARRLRGLVDADAIAPSRAVEAEHEAALARTDLQAAESRIGAARGQDGGVPLRAPLAGTVIEVRTSRGAPVEEGEALLRIADLRQLWLQADIPEADLGRIGNPTGAYFQLESGPARTLTVGSNARLVAFSGLVDPSTRTVPALFEFDNQHSALRVGMRFEAHVFSGAAQRQLAVPASAVLDDNGQSIVFVMRDGEAFERRIVRTSVRDGDWLGIASGLVAGERVVTVGAYQVRLAATAPAAMGHGHAH